MLALKDLSPSIKGLTAHCLNSDCREPQTWTIAQARTLFGADADMERTEIKCPKCGGREFQIEPLWGRLNYGLDSR